MYSYCNFTQFFISFLKKIEPRANYILKKYLKF
jgi:hypothetical protein